MSAFFFGGGEGGMGELIVGGGGGGVGETKISPDFRSPEVGIPVIIAKN